MQDATYRLIPLRNRAGETVANAIVDVADHEWLDQWRWCVLQCTYAVRRRPGRGGVILMHREILGLVHGDPREGDHINGVKLDNRRANLRIATHAENAQNRHRGTGYGRGTSRYRGVGWFKPKRKWRARVMVNQRSHHLGYYDSEVEAAAAAAAFRAEVFPFASER